MKLAVLGADAVTLAIVRALSGRAGHTIDWVCELAPPGERAVDDAVRALAAGAQAAADWDMLLDPALVDGVLIARSDMADWRAEQLRKFAQCSMPILVSHPLSESMLVYYELDMIRRETGAVMLAYLPCRWHPALAVLMELCRGADGSVLGSLEQVIVERHLDDRSRERVLDQFARDADLVRAVCGEVTRIGAMGGAGEQAGFANVGVQMSGPNGILARWSVGPVDATPGAKLLVIGSRDRAVLTMPAGDAAWRLEHGGRIQEFSGWDPAAAAIEQFDRAIRGEAVEPGWVDAARSVELTEALQRSMEKGRTIELHLEEHTEEATFKGTMASLGCGLLLAGLVLIVVLAIAGQLGVVFSRWPQLLVGLLGLFLLLQLLSFVFSSKQGSSR